MSKKILLSIIFLVVTIVAFSHDYLLLPDEFFIKKGENMIVHLYLGDEFNDLQDKKYQSSETSRFELIEDGKKIDLRPLAKDSLTPVVTRPAQASGLAMVVMERNSSETEQDKAGFLRYLQDEMLSDIMVKAEASPKDKFKEKYTRYLKTLVCVDKPSGSVYREKLGQALEIVLLQNPYKMQYGDDIVAQVWFQGEPLKNASVGVGTKALNGTVFQNNYTTDTKGKIYFKLNRSGAWLVRLVHMQPLTDGSADYQSWRASYSFGFK